VSPEAGNGSIMQIEDAISTEYNIIEEKQIPYRNAGILKKKIMVGEDIEYPLVELGRMEQLNTAIFLGKVALSVDMEHLLANKFDEFASVMIIIEIEDPSADNRILIPEGDYLTLRFQGTHKEAREYYIKILNYAKEKNYIIAGNALEITMIDYGMTNNTQKFVTEIQIPYKKY
jgi:effector-binding domain-containing protein